MATKKKVEVPVEEVIQEVVAVEPEKKKVDLKAIGKKVLKVVFWVGLGTVALFAAGAAVGAFSDAEETESDAGDGTGDVTSTENTESSEVSTGTEE